MLSVQDILTVKFRRGKLFKENYQVDPVDVYLDEVVTVMASAQSAKDFDRLREPKFAVTSSPNSSYSQDEVDDFCDKLILTFDEMAKSLPQSIPTPVSQPKIIKETALPATGSKIVSLTETQVTEKSKEIADMFGDNMFDSPETLAKKVEDILKN